MFKNLESMSKLGLLLALAFGITIILLLRA